MDVLVVNPGSSSCKLELVDGGDRALARAVVPLTADGLDPHQLGAALDRMPPVAAAAVRVVHGGVDLRQSVLVDRALLARLDELAPLAPLHNPASLAAIRVLIARPTPVPVVACFDSAFHATLPDEAAVYAVPWEWTRTWGLRRVGFHGWSHAYAAQRAAQMLARPASALRLVTCHLGAGASLAAVAGGRSVDTTMGFTPMDGLVMATRSGSVDPGILLWLQRHGHLSAAAVERALDRESGLLGLSGVSAAMERVEVEAAAGSPRSQLALAVYDHRLRAQIAAMAAAMGGLDAVVFTGGVGEGSVGVRERAAHRLGFLGIAVDSIANAGPVDQDRDVSAVEARVRTLVVHAREAVPIAAEVRRLLG
ncbi:MAG TPA: acetate/propionate family kinase [Verrucomicrobiae bacterium]|nr:acetate/propionate family kinase [Verrucomicrobiae bacterium]